MLTAAQHRRLCAAWTRAKTDERGVAAIEFAFIGPLMILLFFGLAQLSEAIIASRHSNHAASSLGDLVTQCSNINDSDLSSYFAAGGDLMYPLSTSTANGSSTTSILGQRVTDVVVSNSGATQVQWSQASDSAGLTTAYAPGANVTLPANIVSTTPGDSVIMAETVYKYTFPFTAGGLLPIGTNNVSLSFGQAITFDDKTYFKPRKSATVAYTGTGPGGSSTQTSCSGS